jgi:imidazole glycerol-phosphate synthase subunit HisH
MTSVCILDYGSGNVASVRNLVEALQVDVVVSNDAADIANASHLILPGVGAFGAAMQKMADRLPLEVLEREVVTSGKPFLGICVGMQVLATRGYEFGEHRGLGWIPGTVAPLETAGLRLPHIGWNDIRWRETHSIASGLEHTSDFYFLHSNAFTPDDQATVLAIANYGAEFCAVARAGNIFGVQFHPEKSQRAGMQLLRNFLSAT